MKSKSNKYRESISKFFKKENQTIKLQEVMDQLSLIRKTHDIVCIVPDNTGYSWLGIKNGAIALFPNNIICLPQYYSNTIFTADELAQINNTIIDLKFSKVVYRGFPPYFKNLIIDLKKRGNDILVFVMLGGFLSEFSDNVDAKIGFTTSIELAKCGVIKRLGFNKNGLSETVNLLYNVDAVQYFNKTTVTVFKNSPELDINQLKIGVLGNHDFRKNLNNQIAAALIFNNSKVFVKEKAPYEYLDISNNRLIENSGTVVHTEYVKQLHKMNLNMYVSFSESWGHVILESLAGGVPCLATNTSSIFDSNDYLANNLIVEKFDDSFAIFKKAENVLNNYKEISKECMEHVVAINNKSDELLNQFLD